MQFKWCGIDWRHLATLTLQMAAGIEKTQEVIVQPTAAVRHTETVTCGIRLRCTLLTNSQAWCNSDKSSTNKHLGQLGHLVHTLVPRQLSGGRQWPCFDLVLFPLQIVVLHLNQVNLVISNYYCGVSFCFRAETICVYKTAVTEHRVGSCWCKMK